MTIVKKNDRIKIENKVCIITCLILKKRIKMRKMIEKICKKKALIKARIIIDDKQQQHAFDFNHELGCSLQ